MVLQLRQISRSFWDTPIPSSVEPFDRPLQALGIAPELCASKEPLVAIHGSIATLPYYATQAITHPLYKRNFEQASALIQVRSGILERLLAVNELLRSEYGVELLLLDGYRPLPLQRELFNCFCSWGRERFPEKADEELRIWATQYCSQGDGFEPGAPESWPSHLTGGAVDVTLRSVTTKSELYFGGIFDDPSEISWTDWFEGADDDSPSDLEARRNRRLLFWAMDAAGFANIGSEWWHFEWGTPRWVGYRRLWFGERAMFSTLYGPVGAA